MKRGRKKKETIVEESVEEKIEKPEEFKGYLGAANFETWIIGKYLDSDKFRFSVRILTANSIEESKDGEDKTILLISRIRNLMLLDLPVQDFPYTDLLMSALDRICWEEIASKRIEALEQDTSFWEEKTRREEKEKKDRERAEREAD